MQKTPLTNPRAAALEVLDRLPNSQKTLDALLDESTEELNHLSRKDRGLFNQILYGVLRWRLRLDSVIMAYASRPLKKINPSVLNILRIALFQLLFLDRIPSSAAVNTAVELTKWRKLAKASGFVNGLLRNLLRHPDRLILPDLSEDPVGHISVAASFPPWLVSRWITEIGVERTRKRCDAMNLIPLITVRCNSLVNDLSQLQMALADQVESVDVLAGIPGAATLKRPLSSISDMRAFLEGRFAIQDGAAQLVTLLMAPKPGETVLDACAGLGGKTMHIAQTMHNKGSVVAIDHGTEKLSLLEKEAQRLAISIIRTLPTDLNRPIDTGHLPRFDRILLDAPCSGLGVLRRNPDAKWSAGKKDIFRYAKRQEKFLHHISPFLKENGTLVYCVCSMEPEENESVVRRFLKNHPNFVIKEARKGENETLTPFLTREGYLKTDPYSHGLDGFFAVRLSRTA